MTSGDYAAVKAEILNDPWGLGYSGLPDWQVADVGNADVPALSGQIFRGVIPAYEIVNNTVPVEWSGLSAAEKQRYQTLTGAGQVDTNNANVRSAFAAMFGAGTATRTALAAMAVRPCNRWEVLLSGGAASGGLSLNQADVSFALRGLR